MESPASAKGNSQVNRIFPSTDKRASVKCSVRERFAALSAASGLFALEQRETHVSVRGRFGHGAFVKHGREIVCLLMSARKARAEGDICLLGEGVFLGYGISLAEGEAELIELSKEEVQNASMSPELDVISGYFKIATPYPRAEPPSMREERHPSLLELPKTTPLRPKI
jgi:hypothetical protein